MSPNNAVLVVGIPLFVKYTQTVSNAFHISTLRESPTAYLIDYGDSEVCGVYSADWVHKYLIEVVVL